MRARPRHMHQHQARDCWRTGSTASTSWWRRRRRCEDDHWFGDQQSSTGFFWSLLFLSAQLNAAGCHFNYFCHWHRSNLCVCSGVQYLAQGHFGMQLGGAGILTNNLLITRWPAELQPPPCVCVCVCVCVSRWINEEQVWTRLLIRIWSQTNWVLIWRSVWFFHKFIMEVEAEDRSCGSSHTNTTSHFTSDDLL